MLYFIIFVLNFFILTLLGWIFHWIIHQKWAGKAYKMHYNHHFLQYSTDRFVSDKYRNPGKDNSVVIFGIMFAPIILTVLILTIFRTIPLSFGIMTLIEMTVIAFLNDNLHDSFHLTNSFWHKFWFFPRLKRLHFQHHKNTQTNFSIFNFFWDKVFGTYRE